MTLKLSKGSAEFTSKVIDYLNGLVELDQEAMQELIDHRVDCNKQLADHPTCRVKAEPDCDYGVGMLGVLNGLFGIDPDSWGPIAAVFEDDGTLLRFVCTPEIKKE